jgi:CheY-like chemotaxis protein
VPVKRALVVDDSRTACTVLSRVLESYKLAVDAAESAAEALEYLSTNIPPHVIFMDHMMPGMDGLEALRAIKKEARTAIIPVVMYTSKEGEAYMGQARALGAAGVLSKPINRSDLEKIIHDLSLLPDQSSAMSADSDRKAAAVMTDQAPPVMTAVGGKLGRETPMTVEHEAVSLMDRMLEDQRALLREDLAISMEDVAERVARKLRRESATTSRSYDVFRERKWPRLVAIAASIITIVVLASWYTRRADLAEASKAPVVTTALPGNSNSMAHSSVDKISSEATNPSALTEERRTQLDERNIQTTARLWGTIENLKAQMADQRRKLLDTIEWTINLSNYYRFDQVPLGDNQLLLVNDLISRLAAIDFKGTLRLRVYSGDFCLVKNEAGEYRVAPDEMPIENCQTGLNLEAPGAYGQLQSLDFARFVANGPYGNGKINIDVVSYGKDKSRYKYPSASSIKTAGEWNRIAKLNNRVEISIIDGSP